MAETRNPTWLKKPEKITEFIITNRMTPGMRLPTETEFLAQLGVSRGTLRECSSSFWQPEIFWKSVRAPVPFWPKTPVFRKIPWD